MKKSTSSLKTELKKAEDFDRYVKKNRENFITPAVTETLNRHIREAGITKAELSRRAGMSEVYLHQILAGRRTPSRNRTLTLCIALGLSLDDTEALLRECGYAGLYVKNKRDAAILFAIEKKWTVYQLNEKLYEMGEETLL